MQIREYTKADLPSLIRIWNEVVEDGIFPAGGDSKFGFACDAVTLWCVTVPLGAAAAFLLGAPVMLVYFLLNLDEIIKLPVVFRRFYQYRWIKNLTDEGTLNPQE